MKKILKYGLIVALAIFTYNCGGVKVLDAWKSPDTSTLKEEKVLVLARTSNTSARNAFERKITDELISRGVDAVPSYSVFPPLAAAEDLDEEKMKMIRDILGYEGFDAIVITSIKDVRERTVTSGNNYYFNDPWNTFYPSYYGSFYGYYYQPYVYGVTIGDTTPTTYTAKTYYLETVAYNLKAAGNDQLLAVVTTSIDDPKDAYKAADKYTEEIFKALLKN